MSTYYYLDCKTHNEAVYITNNKGDPPDREPVKSFLMRHGLGRTSPCEVVLEYEHTIEYDNIKRFKDFLND